MSGLARMLSQLSVEVQDSLGHFHVIEWLAAQRPPVLQGLQFFGCGLPESLRVAHFTVLQYPCAFRENQRPPDFLCSQQHESTHRFRSLLTAPQGFQTPLETTHTTCWSSPQVCLSRTFSIRSGSPASP